MIRPQVVLGASALLAMLHNEPGGEDVVEELENGVLSSVNLSEVIQQSLKRNVKVTALREDLEAVGLTIFPFNADDAGLWCPLNPAYLKLRCIKVSELKLRISKGRKAG
jgi:PIN domain nuclease of toxin-antitoxin system